MILAPGEFLISAAIVWLLSATLALLTAARPNVCHTLAYVGAATASLLGLLGACGVLVGQHTLQATLFPLPPLGSFTIRVDSLAAFFVGVISFLGLVISIFSLGYARRYIGQKHVGALGALFNVLLLTMALVPMANDALAFLIVWEVMALASVLLVAFEHEHEATRQACVFYAVLTQIGTGFLIAALLLIVGSSRVDLQACKLEYSIVSPK